MNGATRLFLFLLLTLCAAARSETFDLGGLYTYHYRDGRYADWGDYARHGARIAVAVVNDSGLLGEDRIRLRDEDMIDYHCWPDDVGRMTETLVAKGVLAITGADCSGPAVEIARVAARHGVPVISNGANASALSSPGAFPWFVRVVTPSEAWEGHLIAVAARFGIRRMAHFHTTDAWGLGAREAIHAAATRHGIQLARTFAFPRDTSLAELEAELRAVRDAGIRHLIMTGPTPDTVTFFRAVDALAMNRVGVTLWAAEMISADEGPAAVRGSLGYFAPMARLLPSPELEAFRARLETRLGHPVDPDGKAFFYGALSHDHVLAVGHGIAAAKADHGTVTRANLMPALRTVDFRGATGRVRISPGTNDRAAMPIRIYNSHGYGPDGRTVRFVPVGSVDPETGALDLDRDAMRWPGGTRTPPEPEATEAP